MSAAYEATWGEADAVVSFSVLEHVYRRQDYMNALASTLSHDGLAFVNYDAGHFRFPTAKDRIKNSLGPILARAGHERLYQSFVREAAFRSLVETSGLDVLEARSFNTAAMDIYHRVPVDRRDAFMSAWLDFELAAGNSVETYQDSDSRLFRTRNFILAKHDRHSRST